MLPRVTSGGGRVGTLNSGWTFVSGVIRAWQLCGLAFTRSRSAPQGNRVLIRNETKHHGWAILVVRKPLNPAPASADGFAGCQGKGWERRDLGRLAPPLARGIDSFDVLYAHTSKRDCLDWQGNRILRTSLSRNESGLEAG